MNPEKLDQLDYLVAAFIRRGIYVTTDLFVSRPVDVRSFSPMDGSREDAMNRFKVLAVLNPAAFENWKAFARNCSRTSILTRSGLTTTNRAWLGYR